MSTSSITGIRMRQTSQLFKGLAWNLKTFGLTLNIVYIFLLKLYAKDLSWGCFGAFIRLYSNWISTEDQVHSQHNSQKFEMNLQRCYKCMLFKFLRNISLVPWMFKLFMVVMCLFLWLCVPLLNLHKQTRPSTSLKLFMLPTTVSDSERRVIHRVPQSYKIVACSCFNSPAIPVKTPLIYYHIWCYQIAYNSLQIMKHIFNLVVVL